MIVLMNEILIFVYLLVFGAGFGSFAGASVWRLRARQLEDDKRQGFKVDKQEYKQLSPLIKSKVAADRSRCLRCGETLAWYDLIPFVSWLSTGGRCRYCKKPIGKFEPLMEAGVASVFLLSYIFWPVDLVSPLNLVSFFLWLVAVVLLAVLFAYDLKWFLLPDVVVWPLVGIGAVFGFLQIIDNNLSLAQATTQLGGSVMILSGLYYFLWKISSGKWVGFGDVKLGLALALFLADWRLALVALFAANLIGSLTVIPAMLVGKVGRKTSVPFGPFLITGFITTILVGGRVVEVYLRVSF